MVFGEGFIFLAILIIGFILILRYLHSVKKQQKNQEDFLLSFTHELKTPITSMRLALQTLSKEVPKEKKHVIIENGVIQTQRLSSLIDNVLNASRISSEHYALHPEEVDIIALLEENILHLKGIYPNKINIQKPDKKVIWLTDRYALSSILMNIMDNACKYSTHQSEVKIAVDNQKKGTQIRVSNETNTTYFKENQGSIYKKFKTNKSNNTQNSTGLGLYIAKEFSNLIKANLFYENKEKQLNFFLFLPKKHFK